MAVGAGRCAGRWGGARGGMITHHHHEPLILVGHLDLDRLSRAVPPVRLDRARASLAHGQAHLVKQRFVHTATPRYRGGDQPRGANVRGQRRERDFYGGHLVRIFESWPTLLLGLLGRDGIVHRLVDAENLRQPGDPEDLEYALLRADQIQGAVVRTHSLQAADQHPETGGVKELHLLHVDDELVIVLVDQIDEQLTEPRRRVDIDLAFDVDDFDAVLVVVTQLQIHKSSSAMHGVISASRPARGLTYQSLGWRDPLRHSTTLRCHVYTKSCLRASPNGRHMPKSPSIGRRDVTLEKLCRPSHRFPRPGLRCSWQEPVPGFRTTPPAGPRTARSASCSKTRGRAARFTSSTSRPGPAGKCPGRNGLPTRSSAPSRTAASGLRGVTRRRPRTTPGPAGT